MNFTISPKLFHLLVAPVSSFLDHAIVKHNSNWHVRKFSARAHFLLSLYAQFTRAESANALLEELNDVAAASSASSHSLRQLLAFDFIDTVTKQSVQLNQSSFSRANAHRSYQLWRTCFEKLWPRPLQHLPRTKLEGLGQVVAVDGSLFDCLTRMAWAVYRTDGSKVKGHFFFDLHGLPTKLVLTQGKGSEREVLHQNLPARTTYIIDRGYNDYSLFAAIRAEKAHFVTRLLSNACYTIVENFSLTAAQTRQGIEADYSIYFNSDSGKSLWRVVRCQALDGTHFEYLTSRFDLEATTIVELYRYRWEIETFFWWIKSHLQLRHWYSENENGLLIQLYAALIVYVLLKLYGLYSSKATAHQMPLKFVRWIGHHLFESSSYSHATAYLTFLGFANSDTVT